MHYLWAIWAVVTHILITIPSYRNCVTGSAIPSTRVRDVWRFPNETWVENIAVRANGQILVTIIDRPELYQVNPFKTSPSILIYRFPSAVSALGITETDPNVFTMVDMRTFNKASRHHIAAKVTKITNIPEAMFLNGATLLTQNSGIVLIADAGAGLVWGLDIRTGKYAVVLKDALMDPVPTTPIQLGINSLHIWDDDHLYFTNSWQGIFVRVPLHLANGTAAGPYEVITHLGICDDFTLDSHGTAFITTDPANSLVKVPTIGKNKGVVTVVGGGPNSTRWAGATSTAFGRTKADREVLYVVTNGGIIEPVDGHIINGGRVLAVYGL